MKEKFLIFICAFLLPFSVISDPSDLINFDDPENERYFKSHTIISADLDKEFNFEQDRKVSTIYCLKDVVSNFSPDQIDKFFLKIKYVNSLKI